MHAARVSESEKGKVVDDASGETPAQLLSNQLQTAIHTSTTAMHPRLGYAEQFFMGLLPIELRVPADQAHLSRLLTDVLFMIRA